MYNYDYLNPVPCNWRRKCVEEPKVCIKNRFQESIINTNIPSFNGGGNFRRSNRSYPIFWILR